MNRTEVELVFLALARNCAHYLPALFRLIEELSSEGVKVAAVVGENGSMDDTRNILNSAQQRFQFLTCLDTSFIERIPGAQRTRRLAEARDYLAQYAAAQYPDAKLVCVIDVDNVLMKTPSARDFMSSAGVLQYRRDIFGVSATSFPYYYDLAALRCSGFFDENVLPQIAREKRRALSYYSFMNNSIYRVQREFTSSNLRLCESAFNGLCIYRPSDYRLGSYVDERAPDVCEHVILNERIHASTGRKILVDDRLKVAMPPEHGPQGFAYFAGSRTVKLAQQQLRRLRR
jgi:hypothetical protein